LNHNGDEPCDVLSVIRESLQIHDVPAVRIAARRLPLPVLFQRSHAIVPRTITITPRSESVLTKKPRPGTTRDTRIADGPGPRSSRLVIGPS
jgi:hypothetical protein